MTSLKQIFTWWYRQTFGTFLKILFYGKFVGKDKYGNKYYRSKKDERWVVYSNNIEASRITSDWYLWMHHTIDNAPDPSAKNQYSWQKEHVENLTGTSRAHRPDGSLALEIKKEMKKYESWKS